MVLLTRRRWPGTPRAGRVLGTHSSMHWRAARAEPPSTTYHPRTFIIYLRQSGDRIPAQCAVPLSLWFACWIFFRPVWSTRHEEVSGKCRCASGQETLSSLLDGSFFLFPRFRAFFFSSPSIVVSTLFARLWGRESGKQHGRSESRGSKATPVTAAHTHNLQTTRHTTHHAPHTTRAHAHPYTSTTQAHKNRIADCRELAAR